MKYLRRIRHYFSTAGGVEYLEVVHPTRAKPLRCLRITLLDHDYFKDSDMRHRWQ